jgi:imidazolonepropionase-like amidohydrolase
MKLRIIILVVCLTGLVAACETSPASSSRRSTLVIVSDVAFDGDRFATSYAAGIKGDKVAFVGEQEDAPADALVLDFGNATILPGIIDLHVHMDQGFLSSDAVRSGLTSVRDVGSPIEELPPEDSVTGEVRYFTAGPILSPPKGAAVRWHPDVTKVVTSVRHARENVAHLANDGVSVIKVYLEPGPRNQFPLFSRPVLNSIVKTAHSEDLKVTAHVTGDRGVKLGLATGVDEFAHMPCEWLGMALWRKVVERNIPIVGTLHVREDCAGTLDNAKAFVELGGRLLYGTDIGNAGIPYGLDPHELELMEESGLPVDQVLANATAEAGTFLPERLLGQLRAGAPADMVVVAGDLRTGLSALRQPLAVISNGAVTCLAPKWQEELSMGVPACAPAVL